MTILACRNLTARYNGTPVLDSVDLAVERGEWLGVIGPNGAGKTTLVRALAGVVEFGGEVFLNSDDLRSLGRRDIAARVAVVPQIPVIPEGVTVYDYAMLGRTPYIPYWGTESADDRSRVGAVLGRLDLDGFAHRAVTSLSGGERQRVVLARALAQDAELLLLDEPTTALDLGHQQQVLELVDELRREEGIAVVSTLHDLTFAAQFADRLVLLARGRVAVQGEPEAVVRSDLLSTHFGAEVEVLEGSGGKVVVPVRRSR